MKNIRGFFLSENFQFLEVKFSIYLNWRVLAMNLQMYVQSIQDVFLLQYSMILQAKSIGPDQTAPVHRLVRVFAVNVCPEDTFSYHHEKHNFDALKPLFYIVKLGFTGVIIIFLIFAQKHKLWVLGRTASVHVRTASARRF